MSGNASTDDAGGEPASRHGAVGTLRNPSRASPPSNQQGNRSRQPQQNTTSNVRPNKHIRAPSPLPRSPKNTSNRPPPWTRSHLACEREAFFETRVSGLPEVWSALKLVCELLSQNNVTDAQAILDAANLTCPTGRVGRGRSRNSPRGGVYDERGELYDIPDWVVTDPLDLVEDEEKRGVVSNDIDQNIASDDDDGDDDDDGGKTEGDDSLQERRREEKGKGRALDIGEEVRVRTRLSDRGTDVEVDVGTKQKCSILVRRIQDQIGARRVRLAYLGKILDETATLEEQGWQHGHVLNALVFEGDQITSSPKRSL